MHAIHLDGAPAVASHHARRPTRLELAAATLLVTTVVLHVVAMLPHYFGGAGQPSLWSQPDQAALYGVIAGGWAIALGLGLSSPARVPTTAAFAVGLAAAELGYRLTDLGSVFSRFNSSSGGAGLWLMTAAWVVGAVGAGVAVLAVRRQRHETADHWTAPAPEPAPPTAQPIDPPPADAPTVGLASATVELTATAPDLLHALTAAFPTVGEDTAVLDGGAAPDGGAVESTAPVEVAEVSSPTASLPVAPLEAKEPKEPKEKYWPAPGPLILVGLLALATAGAFLPDWDHYSGVTTDPSTGQTAAVSFSIGNAFHYPWQMIVGNVVAAAAIAFVPIAAYFFVRNKAIVAATVSGVLLALSAQFASAIEQASRAVPASFEGPDTVLHVSLTSWFTLDVLAAYALFAVVMVGGHLRVVDAHEGSDGTLPSTPDARSVASLPWS